MNEVEFGLKVVVLLVILRTYWVMCYWKSCQDFATWSAMGFLFANVEASVQLLIAVQISDKFPPGTSTGFSSFFDYSLSEQGVNHILKNK